MFSRPTNTTAELGKKKKTTSARALHDRTCTLATLLHNCVFTNVVLLVMLIGPNRKDFVFTNSKIEEYYFLVRRSKNRSFTLNKNII